MTDSVDTANDPSALAEQLHIVKSIAPAGAALIAADVEQAALTLEV